MRLNLSIFTLQEKTRMQKGVTSFLEKRKPEFGMKVSSDLPHFYPWGANGNLKRSRKKIWI